MLVQTQVGHHLKPWVVGVVGGARIVGDDPRGPWRRAKNEDIGEKYPSPCRAMKIAIGHDAEIACFLG